MEYGLTQCNIPTSLNSNIKVPTLSTTDIYQTLLQWARYWQININYITSTFNITCCIWLLWHRPASLILMLAHKLINPHWLISNIVQSYAHSLYLMHTAYNPRLLASLTLCTMHITKAPCQFNLMLLAYNLGSLPI